MINQDNYQKTLQFYSQLKNQWADVENAKISMYDYVSGNKGQWNAEDRAFLESQRRPALSYNYMLPILLYLTGSQRQGRSSMRAVPTGSADDEQTAQLLTKLMYWNYNKTAYEMEFSKSFTHCIIGGIGWRHDWYDYIEGHWVCRAFDALRIRFDINTQDSRLRDCGYLQDTQWATKEAIFGFIDDEDTLKQVKADFKFLEPSGATSYLSKQYSGGWQWRYTPRQQQWDFIDTNEGRYRLIDHHEQRDIPEIALIDRMNPENYQLTTGMPPEQITALIAQNPNFYRFEFVRKEFWHTIICPAIEKVIVDEPYPIQTGMFAFKPMVCYDIVPELRETTAVFTNLKDINDSINKRRSTMLEYIMHTVGGNWIAQDAAIQGYEHLYNKNEMGVTLKYRKGYEKPTRDQPMPLNQGLVDYELKDEQAVNTLSGVIPTLRGAQEAANETGVLFKQKTQQAETMFALLFDNTQKAQEMDARSCIKHIQQGMTEPRAIRVLNKNGNPEWLNVNYETLHGILNDVTTGEYDIEIDATRPSATAKQLAFYELADLMKTMPPETQILLLDKLLQSSDIADSNILVKRIQAIIKKNFGFDPENPEQLYSEPTQGAMQDMNQQIPTNQLQSAMMQAGVR